MTAPANPEVPAERTGVGLSLEAWTRSRHAAAFDAVLARGVDRTTAWRIATALLGHWSIECGWGRAEWRFNVGNVKVGGWTGPVQRLPDGLLYRAYGDLAAGAEDSVRLASGGRYAEAWGYLLASGDAVGWYDRLTRAGWHPWSEEALATYRSTSARVEGIVGSTPPAAPSPWGTVFAAGSALVGAFWWLARDARRR